MANVRIPVLAVVGAQDEATPVAMSREVVARLPNITLTILDGLAHVPRLQAPQRFLDAVVPFLSSCVCYVFRISALLGSVLSMTLRACSAPTTGKPFGSSSPIRTRTDAWSQ